MKKLNLMLSLLMVLCIGLQAQTYQKTAFGIKTQINSTDVEIQFYSSSTVRILKSPVGKPFAKESLTVVKKPQATKFTVNQQGDVVSLKSNKLKVDVDVPLGFTQVTVSVLVVAAFALAPAVPVGVPASEKAPENVPKAEQR